MIIKNIATGKEYDIPSSDWIKMKETHRDRLFKVISKEDTDKKKLLIPKEILEYQKEPKKLKISKSEE